MIRSFTSNSSPLVMGVSGAINHDAAICMVQDGEILFASHSERYSKRKNDPDLNFQMIQDAIHHAGKPDMIAWYERPMLKKLRQLRAGQYSLAFDSKELPRNYMKEYEPLLGNIPIKYQSHHRTHAASGYYTSPFDSACIVVIDSIGEFETMSFWKGEGNKISKVYSQSYPHSIGLFYSAMTQRLGLKPQEDEYILMGMAAYGDPHRKYKGKELIQHIYDTFDIRHDNGLNTYTMSSDTLFRFMQNLHRGCNWFLPELDREQDHFDLAAATQFVYEKMLQEILWKAKQRYLSENLVLMGGCALNCSANSLIAPFFKNIWIMPNPGDAGSCIGATQKYMKQRINWQTPYLGHEIEGEYPTELVLNFLTNENYKDPICGIASGRAEFGPRALGNRTLCADPRGKDIKDKVNAIKQRQEFRPFAPMILEEYADEYFEGPKGPYMQFVSKCKYPKDFPAIIHKDGTSRVQTVNKQQHPDLHDLLTRFKDKTGCPMLLNTSLNIKGMPIVNDKQDAFNFTVKYQTLVFTSVK